MRPRILFIGCLVIFLLSHACRDKGPGEGGSSKTGPVDLSWLEGGWKCIDQEFYEYWKKENDSLFIGMGLTIKGSDTVVSESLKLIRREGRVFYVAEVPGQNSDLPVSFELRKSTEGTLIFENRKHDFPTSITYKRQDEETVQVILEGAGTEKVINLMMKRIRPDR